MSRLDKAAQMKIATVSHQVPSKRVGNEELIQEIIDRNAGHLDAETRNNLQHILRNYFAEIGLTSRYHRAEGEKSAMLGMAAARDALDNARLHPNDIDLLIYVGVGRGWIEPAMANLFLSELNLNHATGFDIVDACASWLRAIDLAYRFIQTGKYRCVMILNCEFNFREYANFFIPDLECLDYLLPTFTIGEAATATIVTEDHSRLFFHSIFKTWGEYHDLCKIPLPNQNQYSFSEDQPFHPALLFYAFGTPLTQACVKRIISTVRSDTRLRSLKVDICFGHMVSETVTSQVERLLRFPRGKIYRIFSEYGNTVSASIPLAMSLALQDGSLRREQTVLLIAGSAGISVGFIAFEF